MKAHGYLRIDGPEGRIEEDTVKCNHCQKIGFVSRGKVSWPQISPTLQDHFSCKQCYEPICPSCANKPCRHFEKWLDAIERGAGASRLRLEKLQDLAYRAARTVGLV